jgi:hypothetical protein
MVDELAAQELVSWPGAPITRVVVFEVGHRTRIAASPPRSGIAKPGQLRAGLAGLPPLARECEEGVLLDSTARYLDGRSRLPELLPI